VTQDIKELVQPQFLPNSTATILPASTSSKYYLNALNFTNSSSGTESFTVYLVPPAGTAGNGNALIKARPLMANKTDGGMELVGQVLEAGATIQAFCSASNAINVSISGWEIT
jgi:hypothetical protein